MTFLLSLLRICTIVCLVLVLCTKIHAGITTPFSLITNAKNVIVWQEFHPWLMITEDLSSGRTCYYHSHTDGSRLYLKPPLSGTWVPLGSAIKWLMYVDYYQGLYRLMAHDVDWHAYYIAWRSTQNQVGCGMVGTKCIFGQSRASRKGDHYPVDLYHYDVASGICVPFCWSDSEKSQFAHDGNLIVYCAHFGPGDDRIYGIYFSGGSEFEIANRPGISPSVCGSLVAWAEPSGGGFNIVGKNISTGEMRLIAHTTANPPRPQVGRGAIFWQDARNAASTGIDIYGYDWQTGREFVVTGAAGDQIKLRVCDDLVTWVIGATNYQTLWGAYYTPPATINDLRLVLVTEDSATLSWTSPGSTENPATTYDIRMRTDNPITDANWVESIPVSGMSAPKPPGEREEFTVRSLPGGRRYFAIKARMANGEWSLISNCVSAFLADEECQLREGFGSYVSFTGIVTGRAAEGAIYCRRAIAPAAVCALPAGDVPYVSLGRHVTLTGILIEDAEFIGPILSDAYVILREEQSDVSPYAMLGRAVGGKSNTFGGTVEGGALNVWMPVRLWGKISGLATAEEICFRIDDGSGVEAGVLVKSRFAPPANLANGVYAVVEGIVRLSRTSGRQIEVVREEGIRVITK